LNKMLSFVLLTIEPHQSSGMFQA